MAVIAECRIGTNEDIIFYAHPIPDLNPTFYCNIVANDNIILNKAVRADITVPADPRTWEHNAVLPNASTITNILRLHVR